MEPNKGAGGAVSELEKENGALALEVAREGIVLLSNRGALPIKGKKIALFGAGARNTSKGGTGSGEVNNRHNVSVEEGLEMCGIRVTTKGWLDDLDKEMAEEERVRDEKLRQIGKKYSVFRFWALLQEIAIPYTFPCGRDITEEDVQNSDTDTAAYVLTRQAGEGTDRRNTAGEYYPSEKEIRDVKFLTERYKNTVLVINAGACIEVGRFVQMPLGAIVFMGQAGQAGGQALAQLMLGQCNFSGKLAATWPKKLTDLPCSDSFSYLDGNTDRELYKDGIYVGYRFYDTFGVEPQYAFGYGLSYTKFSIRAKAELEGASVCVKAKVTNEGTCAGKETVQVYLSCPSGVVKREYQQLSGFAKTGLIQAGESEETQIRFDLADFAAYDERRACFILEKGDYAVRAGGNSRETEQIATVVLEKECVVEQCRPIGAAQGRVREIEAPVRYDGERCGDILYLNDGAIVTVQNDYAEPKAEILPQTLKMSDKELADVCVGDPSLMSGRLADVAGACGQIDKKVCKKYGFRSAVMADGPAGIRIAMQYAVEPNGKVKAGGKLPPDLVKAKRFFRFLEHIWSKTSKKAKSVYQYCTAWPCATVQAQTFDPELLGRVGRATAKEMMRYGVGIWLAPGMNIQRFPLCGRNYEYYSEDPWLTAQMASALTLGVQENKKCAVTVKHFCCNNQEDNRMRSSSEVNERALREIYLKAFKWTLRRAHPKCVMSSYNKVNGQYVNSSHDLIVNTLRCEYGHDGIVMTDWQSVAREQARAGEVLSAENDLIMAGDKYQHAQLLEAVKTGKAARSVLQKSASRILKLCRDLDS